MERSFIYNRAGQPQGVILPWELYIEVAETFGWDLSDEEAANLRVAMNDSREGNREAFISIEELEHS